MFDCGCHDNDTSAAFNMAFFVHSPRKPTTTQKNNGAFKNLFPTLLHFLQESLLKYNFSLHGKQQNVSHLFGDFSLQCCHITASSVSVRSIRVLRFIARSLLLLFISAILCTELISNGGINLLEQRTGLKGKVDVMYMSTVTGA